MFGLFKFICTLGLYIKFSTKVWFQYGFCNFSYCFIKFQFLISIYIELCKRWFGILNCYLKNFHNFCRKKYYLKNEIKLNHLGYYKLCSEKYFCSRAHWIRWKWFGNSKKVPSLWAVFSTNSMLFGPSNVSSRAAGALLGPFLKNLKATKSS